MTDNGLCGDRGDAAAPPRPPPRLWRLSLPRSPPPSPPLPPSWSLSLFANAAHPPIGNMGWAAAPFPFASNVRSPDAAPGGGGSRRGSSTTASIATAAFGGRISSGMPSSSTSSGMPSSSTPDAAGDGARAGSAARAPAASVRISLGAHGGCAGGAEGGTPCGRGADEPSRYPQLLGA